MFYDQRGNFITIYYNLDTSNFAPRLKGRYRKVRKIAQEASLKSSPPSDQQLVKYITYAFYVPICDSLIYRVIPSLIKYLSSIYGRSLCKGDQPSPSRLSPLFLCHLCQLNSQEHNLQPGIQILTKTMNRRI